jgi:hypothetical protein
MYIHNFDCCEEKNRREAGSRAELQWWGWVIERVEIERHEDTEGGEEEKEVRRRFRPSRWKH